MDWCGRSQPTVGAAIRGQVVMGSIRKAEQTSKQSSFMASASVFALTSLGGVNWKPNKPLYPQLSFGQGCL